MPKKKKGLNNKITQELGETVCPTHTNSVPCFAYKHQMKQRDFTILILSGTKHYMHTSMSWMKTITQTDKTN